MQQVANKMNFQDPVQKYAECHSWDMSNSNATKYHEIKVGILDNTCFKENVPTFEISVGWILRLGLNFWVINVALYGWKCDPAYPGHGPGSGCRVGVYPDLWCHDPMCHDVGLAWVSLCLVWGLEFCGQCLILGMHTCTNASTFFLVQVRFSTLHDMHMGMYVFNHLFHNVLVNVHNTVIKNNISSGYRAVTRIWIIYTPIK